MKTVVTTLEPWRKQRPGEGQPIFTTRRSAVFLQQRNCYTAAQIPPFGVLLLCVRLSPSIAVADVGDRGPGGGSGYVKCGRNPVPWVSQLEETLMGERAHNPVTP